MAELKKFAYYQQYAKDFAKNDLGKELDIPVEVNKRIKSLGVFFYHNDRKHTQQRNGQHKIAVNPTRVETHEEMVGIIKHEVIHWYCYREGMNYNDGEKDFETMLYKHNAPSTYFGMKSETHSKYIQRKIMNDEMNNLGVKGAKYKKCDVMECYSLIEENDRTLIDDYKLKCRNIASTYKVYYDNTQIGYVISEGYEVWMMVNNDGVFTDEEVYKTRKDAVLPHIFEYEKHQAG